MWLGRRPRRVWSSSGVGLAAEKTREFGVLTSARCTKPPDLLYDFL